MTTNKQPKPYLLNIINSLEAINSYKPNSEDQLSNDRKSYDAILMRLLDVGENLIQLRDLFPTFWDENAIDAWNKAIGLRNIISYGYVQIKLSIIWELISKDLPEFEESVRKIVE
jgi:uncharacterized protein with HEPN domain